jgi:hypothetical protein
MDFGYNYYLVLGNIGSSKIPCTPARQLKRKRMALRKLKQHRQGIDIGTHVASYDNWAQFYPSDLEARP